MRIAVLEEPGRFRVADEPEPRPGPGDVLLRVAACGVCASELDIWRGRAGHASFPWYPGHEVGGVVERVGPDVGDLAPGDAVAAWVTERGFAERVVAPAEHCVPAEGAAADLAAGEPLACAVNAVELAGVSLGDDVVVIGAGFMGLLILQLAALRGPRHLIAADVRDEPLGRASALGATRTVRADGEDLAEVVRGLTDGRGADVTIEATGAQAALDVLGDVTRMSGTVAIAGYHQGPPRLVDLARWNWMAFRIVNAHVRDPATIVRGLRTAVRLLSAKRVSLDGLVTHRFGLDEIDEAFRTAVAKPEGFVKATVVP